MTNHKLGFTLFTLAAMTSLSAFAQSNGKEGSTFKLTGSVQTDWILPEDDDAIGANKNDYRGDILGNTYINLNLDSKYLSAGVRFETMENPLPGYEILGDTKPFHGTGLPYFQVTATNKKWIEGTVGTFYEQFGSGFILRAYEERSLGIDNSILGGRIVLSPYKGIRLKMLGGVQRYHFSWNTDNPLYGADLELNLDQWSQKMQDKGHYLTLGISGVTRYDDDTQMEFINSTTGVQNDANGVPQQTITTQPFYLNMPKQVGAMDLRLQWQYQGYNILAEYAMKSQDPSNNVSRFENGEQASYIFRHGNAFMLSASYSQRGFSAQVMAKRSEDMGFRSDRHLSPIVSSLYVNHQPAFAYQHTYSLATLYPYGTQMDGEWAFQGELSYRFKRGTGMGGKYGTLLRLNMSHIRGLDKEPVSYSNPTLKYAGTKGYEASFFGMTDDVYYQDINLTMEKKLNKKWKLTTMYMYQQYNQEVIEGHANNGKIVKSHILVGDASWSCSKNFALRMEGQYLTTKQDQGDWAYASVEMSLYKDWMISLADQYNTGLNGGTDTHYFSSAVVWTKGSSRLQVGYGRTREGLNCTGGVCRKVPAQRGLTASWNYIF